MALRDFLRQNARWLAAGMLLSAGSGFGQTYFISIFAGNIRDEFALSHGAWGGTYTIGTMMSAALMLWAGALVDKTTVRQGASVVLAMFAMVCVLMSVNQSAILLIFIVFGLRFCGQGMLSHIPMVAAGRWFAARRGRAVAIIALGFSLGEASLPFLFVAISEVIGWRQSWMIAAMLALLLIPIVRLLLRKERTPEGQAEIQTGAGMDGRHWTRREAVTHWLFWMMVPAFMMLPVFSTALFFQQVHLTETKGWSLVGFVAFIPVASGMTILTMLVTGPAIDRFGTRVFVMIFLLPMVIAFLVFGFGTGMETAGIGFALMGISQGMNAALAGTFWPEFYGTRHLGAIRSVATSFMVFSSALGPGLTGLLIDLGYPFEVQMPWIAGLALLSAGLATMAMVRVGRITAVA